MSDLQIYVTLIVFGSVILVIAFDLLDMMVTALLGVSILLLLGVLENNDIASAFRTASGPLSLLFGGMIVARVLGKTGIFEWLSHKLLQATQGSGRSFLLLLVLIVAVTCSLLPNATTVILLAPIVIGVAKELDFDFVGPMIFAALISNSAGMLTLVGDPATFLVGNAIGLSFGEYIRKVSLGGLLAVILIIPLMRILLPDIWKARVTCPVSKSITTVQNRWFIILSLMTLAIMVGLFLVGEHMPKPIFPPAVAIIGASLALLVVHSIKIEPLDNVIRDIDWKTLIFLSCIFILVQAFIKTGLLQSMSMLFYGWFGNNLIQVALTLLFGIGFLSCFLANIPVVAASLVMTKGYLVIAEAVPETALMSGFTEWPVVTIPVFVAMMFGGTLGGNATLIGASANIVAAGICAKNNEVIGFGRFLKYGLPVALTQLVFSAIYVLALRYLLS